MADDGPPLALDMRRSIREALRLTPAEGGSIANLLPEFSNAPVSAAPERGGPLGGLVAGLAVKAARQQLQLKSPLQSLSVQFLATARFAPVLLRARSLRGGRSTAYVEIIGQQGTRQIVAAHALFSVNRDGPALAPPERPPPLPPASLTIFETGDPTFPWFHRRFEYRFDPASRFGQGSHPPYEAVWMRTRDETCLDEARLCALLDAIYPTFMTSFVGPAPMALTTAIHYELLEPVAVDAYPDGWIHVEFRTQHLGQGWAVEDAVAFSPDGRPIALARQRRKIIARGEET